jgi:hypothetical protein
VSGVDRRYRVEPEQPAERLLHHRRDHLTTTKNRAVTERR